MSAASIALLVAIAVLALVWLVRNERRRSAERARALSAMGFQPVARPDPALVPTLLPLLQLGGPGRRPQRIALARVFERELRGGRLVSFDATASDRRRSSSVASGALAVVRPGARLPAFGLLPFSERGGTVSRVMVHLMAQVLEGAEPIRFDDVPEFDRQFTAFAPAGGAEAARAYLAPGVRLELASLEPFILAAGGDTFTVQRLPSGTTRDPSAPPALRKLVDDAVRLAEVLRTASGP